MQPSCQKEGACISLSIQPADFQDTLHIARDIWYAVHKYKQDPTARASCTYGSIGANQTARPRWETGLTSQAFAIVWTLLSSNSSSVKLMMAAWAEFNGAALSTSVEQFRQKPSCCSPRAAEILWPWERTQAAFAVGKAISLTHYFAQGRRSTYVIPHMWCAQGKPVWARMEMCLQSSKKMKSCASQSSFQNWAG